MGDLSIRSARIYPYKLKLAPAIQSKYGPFREGRLVALTAGSGTVGWGDAAPLPGFSLESVEELDQAWRSITKDLPGLTSDFEGVVAQAPAALAFGLEQARWSIEGQTRGVLPPALLDSKHRDVIQIAGLVDAEAREAPSLCGDLIADGCRSIKLKTGRWDREDAVRFFKQIRGSTGSEIDLHIDANRAWSLDDACLILESAVEAGVDYVEEPLRNPRELPRLAERVPIPIALDESLIRTDPESLSDLTFARFAILKPSILGGLKRSLDFARAARAVGIIPLASSAIESGLGLLWLVALASTRLFGEPAGLDTYRYLQKDILADSFEPGFEIDVSETERLYQTPAFDE